MITAKKLRELLASIPDDTPIILQTDDEGNGYRFINGIDFEEGEDGSYFDGDESCIRQHEIEEYGSGSDYQHVAVIF